MEARPLSSSVTIDWRAVRESERQACLALRAELAQLQAREKQLRIRSEAVSAAHGRLAAEIHRVGRARGSADSAELGRLVSEARMGLARSASALDQAIGSACRERARRAAAAPAWTARSGSAMAPAPQAAPDIDLEKLTRESSRRSAPAALVADAALAAEADAVIEECRLRCPEADLAELTGLRAELDASPLRDRTVIQDIRIRAARTIQRVKRENEREEQRQRLFVLAEDAPAAERAPLRRRVADARPEDVPRLDQEVAAAVERASAERSRAEAVAALVQSLQELGYDVQGGFASLLPSSAAQSSAQRPAGARPAALRFLVAASPHSADHGLRMRAGEDQLYLSVVRRAGTATGDSRQADTDVQEQTCRDLVTAAAAAAGKGVQIILGNAQPPGRPAPELAAEHWPAATSASAETASARAAAQSAAEQSAAEQAGGERRRAWAAQERQRAAGQQQARSRRPGQ
jgi:hypothetical protein